MIAESIVAAAEAIGGFRIPVVVRLQGTNCDKGLGLVSFLLLFAIITDSRAHISWQINTSGLDNLIVDPDFEAAAKRIVQLTA